MDDSAPVQRHTAAPYQLLSDLLSGAGISSGPVLDDERLAGAILQLADQERVLPALAERVAAGSLPLPKSTRAVLATHYEANRRRNAAFRSVLLDLGEAAAGSGIDLMALKGAAWLLEDDTGYAAWRQMVDIDVLVGRDQFAAMSRLLAAKGYVNVSRRLKDNFHHSFRHPEVPVLVELHKDLGWHPHLLSNDMLFAASREIVKGVRIPESWMRAFHAIIHWQVQDQGHSRRTLPLKEVFEIACFLQRSEVNWQALSEHAARVTAIGECEAALASASILLGAELPKPFTADATARRWVSEAAARRDSQFRTWLATELWRAGTLWRCEKVSYRCAVRGLKAPVAALVLWSARLWRVPVVIARLAGILIKCLDGRSGKNAAALQPGSPPDFRFMIPRRSAGAQ